jgi:hypothetical protein
MLPAVTAITTERSVVVALACTLSVIFPFPSVTDAVAVHHEAELLMLHLVLLETVTSDVLAAAVNNSSDEETDNSGAAASFLLQDAKNKIATINPMYLNVFTELHLLI